MKIKPLSVLYSIAECYHLDASDFLQRFCLLREAGLSKAGRIKNFVDLLMACECALKSHIILHKINNDPKVVYKQVRGANHDIEKLANAASYMNNRHDYEFLKDNLGSLSVFIRYSLEAHDLFFPVLISHNEARVNYSSTIGSPVWIDSVIASLNNILNASNGEFVGLVSDNIEEIFKHEEELKVFLNSQRK